MRYLGGKSKIRKALVTHIESHRKPNQTYFEPFCGGGWVLQEVIGDRIASDGNNSLISMYKALQEGWVPPEFVSEEEYKAIKQKGNLADPMYAFCAFGCSFAGKWWGGYARSQGKPCYAATTKRSLMKQLPYIMNVEFRYGLYNEHQPDNMLIYCDPPYTGTTTYGAFDGFDHSIFWNTVREWSANNTVLVSEYIAPDDFECIAEFNSRMGMTADGERGIRIERLFKIKE